MERTACVRAIEKFCLASLAWPVAITFEFLDSTTIASFWRPSVGTSRCPCGALTRVVQMSTICILSPKGKSADTAVKWVDIRVFSIESDTIS